MVLAILAKEVLAGLSKVGFGFPGIILVSVSLPFDQIFLTSFF